jgi:hypothetical protein
MPANQVKTPAPTASGPVTEEQLRAIAQRNEEKRLAAIRALGRRWLLHPANRVV